MVSNLRLSGYVTALGYKRLTVQPPAITIQPFDPE